MANKVCHIDCNLAEVLEPPNMVLDGIPVGVEIWREAAFPSGGGFGEMFRRVPLFVDLATTPLLSKPLSP